MKTIEQKITFIEVKMSAAQGGDVFISKEDLNLTPEDIKVLYSNDIGVTEHDEKYICYEIGQG